MSLFLIIIGAVLILLGGIVLGAALWWLPIDTHVFFIPRLPFMIIGAALVAAGIGWFILVGELMMR